MFSTLRLLGEVGERQVGESPCRPARTGGRLVRRRAGTCRRDRSGPATQRNFAHVAMLRKYESDAARARGLRRARRRRPSASTDRKSGRGNSRRQACRSCRHGRPASASSPGRQPGKVDRRVRAHAAARAGREYAAHGQRGPGGRSSSDQLERRVGERDTVAVRPVAPSARARVARRAGAGRTRASSRRPSIARGGAILQPSGAQASAFEPLLRDEPVDPSAFRVATMRVARRAAKWRATAGPTRPPKSRRACRASAAAGVSRA